MVSVSMFSGLWGAMKMNICARHGILHTKLKEFLHEFSYRHLFSKNGSIFAQLTQDVLAK